MTLKQIDYFLSLPDTAQVSMAQFCEGYLWCTHEQWISYKLPKGWVKWIKNDEWISYKLPKGWVKWIKNDEWISYKLPKGWVRLFKNGGPRKDAELDVANEPIATVEQIKAFKDLNPTAFSSSDIPLEVIDQWKSHGGTGTPVIMWREVKDHSSESGLKRQRTTTWVFGDGITIQQTPKALTTAMEKDAQSSLKISTRKTSEVAIKSAKARRQKRSKASNPDHRPIV
jgi:hypothetical protein